MSRHLIPLSPQVRDQLLPLVELRQNNWSTHEPYLDPIREELERGPLLPPAEWDGLAVVGSTVVCIPDGDRRRARFIKLVLPADACDDTDHVSVISSLGWKLLGMRAGESTDLGPADGYIGRFFIEQVITASKHRV